MARPAKATIRCASNFPIMRWSRHQVIGPAGVALTRAALSLLSPSKTRFRSPRTNAAKRRFPSMPIFFTYLRKQGAGRPAQEVPDYVYSHAQSGGCAERAEYVEIDFARGDRPPSMARHCRQRFARALNGLGRAHGIGRLDLVENRFVGMKSRGMYETPGGTILYYAHRGLSRYARSRCRASQGRADAKYASSSTMDLFSPEREMLQASSTAARSSSPPGASETFQGSAFVVGVRALTPCMIRIS